tara:strand:+ start:392 stop:1129 length:738 start_codon:yes stop_codon:yes gene_type:complete
MHNGVTLNQKAIEVVNKLKEQKKRIVFLSNAPRPSSSVINFLKTSLKMDQSLLTEVITSGEAALKSIQEQRFGKKFFHLGPPRDRTLFVGLEKNLIDIKKCDFILCTGLFDEKKDNLNFYKEFLSKYDEKKFICTNPDLTVHKGNIEEYCAGSVAKIFEELGGKVTYFGKPYKEIYEMCLNKNQKTLIVGDNLRTDILGANNLKLDSVFISKGVHRSEFKSDSELINLAEAYKVKINFFQESLEW